MYVKEAKRDKTSARTIKIKYVLLGVAISIASTLALSALAALIMTGEGVPDSTIYVLAPASGLIGAFAGSFFAALKNKRAGLLTGSLIGVVLFVVLLLLSFIFRKGGVEIFSLKTLATLALTLASSMAGGICGVNIKRRRGAK